MKARCFIACIALFFLVPFISKQELCGQKVHSKKTRPEPREVVLNRILGRLYESSGYRNFPLPKVVLVRSGEIAASYSYSGNLIKFEEKLYQICRSFGRDSLSAMAFILSHELYHAIEKSETNEQGELSFLEHSMTGFSQALSEENADIWGSFLCYLAGFDPSGIFENLFEKIYESYRLADITGTQYPSLEERKKCIRVMLDRVDELILIFELGLVLSIETEFELAEHCYRHILQFYKGPEIYNNLGITKAYQAMSTYGISLDRYYYPFELDLNSKLYNIAKSRGERTAEDLFLRHKILEQALSYFYKALEIDRGYLPGYSNVLSCLNLMDRPQEAIRFFDSLRLQRLWNQGSGQELDKLSLAIGISYALSGRDECKEYFRSCLKSGDLRSRVFSQSNLQVYADANRVVKSADCPILDEARDRKPFPDLAGLPARDLVLGQNGRIQIQFYKGLDFKHLRLGGGTSSGLAVTRAKPSPGTKNNLRQLMGRFEDHAELSFIPGKTVNFLKCRSDENLYMLGKNGTVLERIIIRKI